jgi:hypothetical protein
MQPKNYERIYTNIFTALPQSYRNGILPLNFVIEPRALGQIQFDNNSILSK